MSDSDLESLLCTLPAGRGTEVYRGLASHEGIIQRLGDVYRRLLLIGCRGGTRRSAAHPV